MTGDRSTSSLRVSLSPLLLSGAMMLSVAGCCGSGSSGGLANLVPGRKEAEFRERVEHDSFPNAAQPAQSQSAEK